MAIASLPTLVIRRAPQTDAELHAFVQTVWGVHIPWTRVCAHHQTPFAAFADAYFTRSPMAIWQASRGFGGKSFLLATLALTEMVTMQADVNILGGSGQQSRRVHEAMQQLWNSPYAPRSLLAKEPTQYETQLVTGAKCIALMASQGSVRGPHPQKLLLDECDEMDLKILDASLGQPMGARGIPAQVVMSSTHQYADGTFTELLRRAKAQQWSQYFWCYRETMAPHGWLAPPEVEAKRQVVTSMMWDIEYEGFEPSGGMRAILPEAVEAAFDPALGTYQGQNGEALVFLPPPLPNFRGRHSPYATGTDWAKESDWTIIASFLTADMPWRAAAWERLGRLSWPRMVAALDARVQAYGGRSCHDSTGLGDVIDDYLTEDSTGVQLVGRARHDIFSEYIAALEGGKLVSPRIQWAYDEHRYVTQEDLYGSGHPPDSFVAGALAWHTQKVVPARAGTWGR